MKVKELIEALSQYPEDMEVCVHTNWDGWQSADKIERGIVRRCSQTERKWKEIEILAIGRIGQPNYETE